MPLTINLPQLTRQALRVEGRLRPAELHWDRTDEMLDWGGDLSYCLRVQRVGDVIRLEGSLAVDLACHCVRCLKPFCQRLTLDPWTLEIALEGEDAVVVQGDLVDLTPFLREDTVLALPQHPLCDPGCGGQSLASPLGGRESGPNRPLDVKGAAWSALDRLKF
jgi:uncharacterized protein